MTAAVASVSPGGSVIRGRWAYLCVCDLPMHVRGRGDVCEPMTGALAHPRDTALRRRHEHDVVELGQPSGSQKRRHEPGPDHPVVDDVVAAGRQPSGSASSRLDDDLVLVLRFRAPGRDGSAIEEGEGLVAENQRARVNPSARMRATIDLPAARRAGHDDQFGHHAILTRRRWQRGSRRRTAPSVSSKPPSGVSI